MVERPDQRHVLAYLTQDEVLAVGLGDEVELVVPAASRQIKGRVARIDRTDGFRRENETRRPAGYDWRGPKDRSAVVIIALENMAEIAADATLRPGTPVIAVFPRRATNAAVQTTSQQFLPRS